MMNLFTRTASLATAAACASLLSSSTVGAQCPQPKPVIIFAWLAGAYDTTFQSMKDSLVSAGVLPAVEPYTALGYQYHGGGGGEVFDTETWPYYIVAVDWVVVELRDPREPAKLISSKSGIITGNGSVINPNGTTLSFCVPPGNYHVALRHRNHLAVMTALPVPVDGGFHYVDFTIPSQVRGGTSSLKPLDTDSTVWGLWPGNVNFDNAVKYTGVANDRDPILVTTGGSTPNTVVQGTYAQEDVNLDSRVKYTGQGNDRDIILTTVGSTAPNNVRRDLIPTDSLHLRSNVHLVDQLPWTLDPLLSDTVGDPDSTNVMVFQFTDSVPDVEVGDVIVGADPRGGGFLRLIDSISYSPDQFTAITSQAGMSDLFDGGTLTMDFPTTDTVLQSMAGGRSSFYYAENISLPFSAANALNVKLEHISMDVSSRPVLDVEFAPSGMIRADIGIRGLNIMGGLKLRIDASAFVDSTELYVIKDAMIANGMFLAGGVPVFYDVTLNLKLVGKIECYGQIDVSTEMGLSGSGDITATYSDGIGWTTNNDFLFDYPNFDAELTNAAFGVRASLAMAPEVQMKLWRCPAGPYLSSGPELKADLMVATGAGEAQLLDHDLKASAKWKTKFGVKAKITDRLKLDHAFTYESDSLIAFRTPARIDTAATLGNHQVGEQGTTLPVPLSVRVVSEITSPLFEPFSLDAGLTPVNFQVVSGGGTVTNERVFTDGNGRASTVWTLGSEPLSHQRVKAWVQNGAGDTIPIPVDFVVDSSYWSLQAISPIVQSGTDGTPLLQDIQVRLVNLPTGEPVSSADVHFQLVSGGGSLSETIVTTNGTGDAFTSWTLPLETTTPQHLRAYVLDFAGNTIHPGPIDFYATYGGIGAANVDNGASNTGNAGSTIPIHIQLSRGWGAGPGATTATPLSGRSVEFEFDQGNGTFVNAGSAMTGPDGIAIGFIPLPQLHGGGSGRAFHVNTFGDTSFTAFGYYVCDGCPPFVSDVDGNSYPVVNIGCQCWTAANLKTTKFKNGDLIPLGINIPASANDTIWGDFNDRLGPLTGPARGAKHFISSNVATYGWLYNARVIEDGRGVCPEGWRLPSMDDFEQLILATGGDSLSGPALRSTSGLWNDPPVEWAPWATNPHRDTYGFNLKPGGSIPHYCCPNTNPCCTQTEAEFLDEIAGEDAYLWTSERGLAELGYTYSFMDFINGPISLSSGQAYSCRCLLNE